MTNIFNKFYGIVLLGAVISACLLLYLATKEIDRLSEYNEPLTPMQIDAISLATGNLEKINMAISRGDYIKACELQIETVDLLIITERAKLIKDAVILQKKLCDRRSKAVI